MKAQQWELILYIAGETNRSAAAISNLKHYCNNHFGGNYRIEVIDLLKHPHLAETDQILAIPTLVRRNPPPVRKIFGDLSNEKKVMAALEFTPDKEKIKK